MFRRSKSNRRVRSDSQPRFSRARRLAIETLESRRVLSNNQLDFSVWNLDSLQSEYAIIADGGSLADDSVAPQFRDSGGVRLNLQWVVVPGMSLSPAEADQLAYRHWQSALVAGTFTADEIMPLYTEWRDNVGRHAGLGSVPVYAIGLKGLDVPRSSDGNSIFSGPGYTLFNSTWPSLTFDDASGFVSFSTNQSGIWRDKIEVHLVRSMDWDSLIDFDASTDDALKDLLDNHFLVAGMAGDQFANSIVVAPQTPADPTGALATRDSLAGLGEVIDDLLSEGTIIDEQNGDGLLGSLDSNSSETNSPPSGTSGRDVAGAAMPFSEGGMVSIDVIVATVAEGSLPATTVDTDIAVGGEDLGLGGELARVAVMELIEGATEPTAPALGHDTITVLAMNDAAGAMMQFVTTRGSHRTAGEWLAGFEYVVDQAGVTVAMLLPVDASRIAGIASAAGSLLASIASGSVAGSDQAASAAESADGARNALFSELGEEREEALAGLGREHLVWLAAVPVAALLAAERLMAPRRKATPKPAALPVAQS